MMLNAELEVACQKKKILRVIMYICIWAAIQAKTVS